MKDKDKTKEQLINELMELHQRIAEMEKSEARHMRAEEELRESEERYKELWLNAPVAYHILDTKGIITQVNQTEAKMLGYTTEEMVGKSIFEFVLPEQQAEARKRFRHKISGQYIPKAENRMYVRRDGSKVYVSIDDVLERDSKGEVISIRTTIVDITDRKQAEEKLQESEKKYKLLFDSTLDGMAVIDAETMKVVLANQSTLKMYGYSSMDEIGEMNPFDFIPPEDRKRVLKIIAKDMFEKDLQVVNEFRTITKDGKEIWISAVGVKTEYQGKLAGLISFRDVTERKRVEEALTQEQYLVRALLDNVPDRIYFKDTDSRFIRINKALDGWFGLTGPAQAVGKTDFDFYPKEIAKKWIEHEKHIMETENR